MRRAWGGVLLCLWLIGCHGDVKTGEGIDAPSGLLATIDRSEAVHLSWQIGSGHAPAKVIVLRDGRSIAELEPGATSYEDREAGSPRVERPAIAGVGIAGGVEVSWEVVVDNGESHVYQVHAVGEGGEIGKSVPATGHRSVPMITGFTVLREGSPVAQLEATERSFLDHVEIGPVVVPPIDLMPQSDGIQLAWLEPEFSRVEPRAYQVRMELDGGVAPASGSVLAQAGPPEVLAYVIRRDGMELTRLAPGERAFRDLTAGAGRILVGEPAIAPGDGALELSWADPVGQEGRLHSYELGFLLSGGTEVWSPPSSQSRKTPEVVRMEIWRDGELLTELEPGRTGYMDSTARAGSLGAPVVSVQSRSESVELAWETPASIAGQAHSYRLRALGSDGSESFSWAVVGKRPGPSVVGFSIERDGESVALLGGADRNWEDHGAGATVGFGPPLLVAGHRLETGGVRLRWPEPGGLHIRHRYELRGLSDSGPGPAATIEGARRASPSGYEMQRDDGPWLPIDAIESEEGIYEYLDVDAPLGTITAATRVETHPVLWDASFGIDGAPEVDAPAPSAYRIRAVRAGVVGEASEIALAGRRTGTVFSYQWQRSSGDDDSDYSDMPGQRSSSGFDDEALDDPRYYRVQMRVVGAEGVSTAARTALDTFVSLDAFGGFNCGIRASDGKRRCWGGSNDHGQAPMAPSLEVFEQLALGEGFGCGILGDDGRVICWGKNDVGQAPPEPSLETYSAIDATFTYACGIRERDGVIDCWGQFPPGEMPPGLAGDTFEDLALGASHICAIRTSDSRVLCWGDNRVGEAPQGPSAESFIQISAGRQHTCGIRSTDNSVVCWGNNLYGESTPASELMAAESIDAGHMHGCGIHMDDGRVFCWGFGDMGQSPYGPSIHSYDHVTGGFDHSCAIRRSDGRITCWGSNVAAQAPQPFPR